jgi:Xaa-Pro aminopeptidase
MAPSNAIVAEVRRRRSKLQEALSAHEIGAAVLATETSFRYYAGYATPTWAIRARPSILVLSSNGSAIAVVSEAEADRIAAEAVDTESVPYTDAVLVKNGAGTELEYGAAAARVTSGVLKDFPGRRGAELGSHLLPALAPSVWLSLTEPSSELVDISGLIWKQRIIKSKLELQSMRTAASALDATYRVFSENLRVGMTEREIHALFMAVASESIAARVGYLVVIAGIEGAVLGPATERRWNDDALLLVDAGLVVDGYWSDFSRLFAPARPSEAVRRAYSRLVSAADAAYASARSGVRTAELTQAIQSRLDGDKTHGFGRFGHGIGLDLTEPPSLHIADPTRLEEGMALCLEPNSRVAGIGHLVVEQMIVVTSDGAELLSSRVPQEIQVATG